MCAQKLNHPQHTHNQSHSTRVLMVDSVVAASVQPSYIQFSQSFFFSCMLAVFFVIFCVYCVYYGKFIDFIIRRHHIGNNIVTFGCATIIFNYTVELCVCLHCLVVHCYNAEWGIEMYPMREKYQVRAIS